VKTNVMHATVAGAYSAAAVATRLINASKWFEMTPLPDDCYEFVAKDEAGLEPLFLVGTPMRLDEPIEGDA